ncbi:MAG: hypothetical protein AB8G05_28345 [Oligoflexales bacterium]
MTKMAIKFPIIAASGAAKEKGAAKQLECLIFYLTSTKSDYLQAEFLCYISRAN